MSFPTPTVPLWPEFEGRVEVEDIYQAHYEVEDGMHTRESIPALPLVTSFADPTHLSRAYGSYQPLRGSGSYLTHSPLGGFQSYQIPDHIRTEETARATGNNGGGSTEPPT